MYAAATLPGAMRKKEEHITTKKIKPKRLEATQSPLPSIDNMDVNKLVK
jgi:hypothetical protein